MHNSLYKIPLLALAFILASFSAHAQDDDDNWFGDEPETEEKGKISGGIIHVPFGYTSNSKTGLNTVLGNHLLPSLENEELTWGIDGTFIVRNFIVRIGTTNSFAQKVENSTRKVEYQQKLTELGLGYNVFSKKGFIVYPTAHIGRFKSTFISANKAASVGASGVLGGIYVGTEASQTGYYTGAGIGLDYMLGFDESSGAGITFGLQAGYNYQISANNWKAYGLDLGNEFNDDMSGAYVRLSIGFSGWHRQ